MQNNASLYRIFCLNASVLIMVQTLFHILKKQPSKKISTQYLKYNKINILKKEAIKKLSAKDVSRYCQNLPKYLKRKISLRQYQVSNDEFT